MATLTEADIKSLKASIIPRPAGVIRGTLGHGCWGMLVGTPFPERLNRRQRLIQQFGTGLVVDIPENRERVIIRDKESGDIAFSWEDR